MNFPALYTEAWVQPRQSMRRILSLDLSERDRLIMIAITGVLFAIPMIMIFQGIEMPPGPDGNPLPAPTTVMVAFTTLAMVIMGYYITAALIKIVGAVFGGTASYDESKSVSAWTQLVLGLANLTLLLLSFILPAFLLAPIRLVFTVAALYVSSAYIAEAHGFSHTGKVVGVSVAVTLIFVMLLLSMGSPGSLPAVQ